MTPQELAESLAPQVREAAERSKDDIMANLPVMKRVLAKSLWGVAMQDGVPAATRIVIEFLISKYQSDIEPTIGDFVQLLIKSIDEESATPQMKMLRDILSVLHTPKAQFHPAVQSCLDPNAAKLPPVDYTKSE